jgi:hypothetical protein
MPASIVQYMQDIEANLTNTCYDITPSATDGLWTNMYNVLMDLKKLSKITQVQQMINYI